MLGFAGARPLVCVLDRLAKAMDDATPVEELQKTEDRLAPIWLEAVDRWTASVAARPPWPAAPGAVQLKTVKLLGDEKMTITTRRRRGGDHVDVKHDWRVVSFGICGPRRGDDRGVALPATALLHGEPPEGMAVEPTQFDDEQNRESRCRRT